MIGCAKIHPAFAFGSMDQARKTVHQETRSLAQQQATVQYQPFVAALLITLWGSYFPDPAIQQVRLPSQLAYNVRFRVFPAT